MRRPIRENTKDAGQDSFLDIVANIVGILIILVMVVGVRVRNSPVAPDAPDEAAWAESAAVAEDEAAVASLRGGVLAIEGRITSMHRETATRDRERIQLATAVSAANHLIETRHGQLDGETRQQFDLRRALSETRTSLETIRRRRAAARAAETTPELVKSYPTPLSRTVDDYEAHFRLDGGRIVFVPMRQIAREFKADARAKVHGVARLGEITETIGPIGGFRVKYTLERRTRLLELDRGTGAVSVYVELKILTIIPTRSRMGETLDEAFAEGSEFRRALAPFRPGRATVTIWTYPDSFAEFRRLKKELYQLGYETAGRPLFAGAHIAASPDGTKSAAQ